MKLIHYNNSSIGIAYFMNSRLIKFCLNKNKKDLRKLQDFEENIVIRTMERCCVFKNDFNKILIKFDENILGRHRCLVDQLS